MPEQSHPDYSDRKKVIDSGPFLQIKKLGAHMARPRHQHGWLEESSGKWIAYWYAYIRLDDGSEQRRRRERVVGRKPAMKRWEALKELKKLIDSDPAVASARPDPRVSLEWFWTHRFKPLAEARWRKSTLASMPYIVAKHILPKFGPVPLRDLQRFDFQSHLNHLAKTSSRSLVKKVRNLLHAILEEAIASEYLDRSPAARLTIPEKTRKPCDRHLSLAEIEALEKGLEGRERLVFHCFTLLGLRPGELFARSWKDVDGERLWVQSAVYRGLIGETKTQTSKGFVWLPKLIQYELATYRERARHNTAEDFIFCAAHGRQRRPIDTHNYLRRILKPACAALGVPEVTFASDALAAPTCRRAAP